LTIFLHRKKKLLNYDEVNLISPIKEEEEEVEVHRPLTRQQLVLVMPTMTLRGRSKTGALPKKKRVAKLWWSYWSPILLLKTKQWHFVGDPRLVLYRRKNVLPSSGDLPILFLNTNPITNDIQIHMIVTLMKNKYNAAFIKQVLYIFNV